MELTEIISRLHQLRGITLSRKLATDIRFGDNKSGFKGSGYELADIREWRPGEPLRGISWKLSLRTYPEHIYRIERPELKQMPTDLLVDLTPSMRFQVSEGSNKARLLFELVGLLGFTSIRHQDPVSAVGFSSYIELFIKHHGHDHYIYMIIREIFKRMELLNQYPEKMTTNLNKPLEFVFNRFKFVRHTVFLISDFVDVINDENAIDMELLRSVAARHDLVTIVLTDPEEFHWKRTGGVVLAKNPESGRLEVIKGSRANIIRERIFTKRENMIDNFKSVGAGVAVLNYDNYHQELTKFFAGRTSTFR